MEIKQVIKIRTGRTLTKEEAEYYNNLSEEEKEELHNEQKESIYEIFEETDIDREEITELEIEYFYK